jgi:hypothetical protein
VRFPGRRPAHQERERRSGLADIFLASDEFQGRNRAEKYCGRSVVVTDFHPPRRLGVSFRLRQKNAKVGDILHCLIVFRRRSLRGGTHEQADGAARFSNCPFQKGRFVTRR